MRWHHAKTTWWPDVFSKTIHQEPIPRIPHLGNTSGEIRHLVVNFRNPVGWRQRELSVEAQADFVRSDNRRLAGSLDTTEFDVRPILHHAITVVGPDSAGLLCSGARREREHLAARFINRRDPPLHGGRVKYSLLVQMCPKITLCQ